MSSAGPWHSLLVADWSLVRQDLVLDLIPLLPETHPDTHGVKADQSDHFGEVVSTNGTPALSTHLDSWQILFGFLTSQLVPKTHSFQPI